MDGKSWRIPAVGKGEDNWASEERKKKLAAAREARRHWLDLFQAGVKKTPEMAMPYRLYAPKTETGHKYPLVMFLHGIGCCGDDNEAQILQLDGATIWVRDQTQGGEPCFVLAPQCPLPNPEYRWAERHCRVLASILKDVMAEYDIDRHRIYVTGQSMGGYGSWTMSRLYPELIAGVAACCSGCIKIENSEMRIDYDAIDACAQVLKNKPLWLFHAADDPVVPVEVSRAMAEKMEESGRVRDLDYFFTEYPKRYGYGHASWVPAYDTKAMRVWLLEQRL